MYSNKRLLIAGAITLIVGLVILLPARVAWHWLAPDALAVQGLSGSVWRGRIAEGTAAGVYFRNLSWRVKPLSLLAGKLAFSATVDPAGGFAHADVDISLTGRITVRELAASLPLAAFERLAPLNGASGDLSLQLDEARFVDGWPVELHGALSLGDLRIPALAAAPLGNYRAEFQTTDEGIVGSVEDSGGMLELAGTVRLSPDRSYSLVGQVGATAAAPVTVSRQLGYLGSPNARGLREFRFEGTL